MKHARQDYNRIQDPNGQIPDDEPVFLIRGQDVAGPDAVRCWAESARRHGASVDICNRAEEWADVMEAWAKKKTPDMPDTA